MKFILIVCLVALPLTWSGSINCGTKIYTCEDVNRICGKDSTHATRCKDSVCKFTIFECSRTDPVEFTAANLCNIDDVTLLADCVKNGNEVYEIFNNNNMLVARNPQSESIYFSKNS